jgi:hypothetical protein
VFDEIVAGSDSLQLRCAMPGTRIRAVEESNFAQEPNMRRKSYVLMIAMLLIGGAVCFAADDPQMGTWKLNESKSKLGAGFPHNNTVVYEASGDTIKVTIDGTDKDGNPTHSEWTGKLDGKDYPVTGDANSDTRSYKRVNEHTLSFVNKKGGKVNLSGRAVVAADGKTRTVTATGSGADGKKVTGTAVYDKQ